MVEFHLNEILGITKPWERKQMSDLQGLRGNGVGSGYRVSVEGQRSGSRSWGWLPNLRIT